MAEIRRIVDGIGGSTLVDLNSSTVVAERDSFVYNAPPSTPIMAQRNRRFGGADVVGENHANGSISMMLMVSGATAAAALSTASSVLSVLESATSDPYFEWRPEAAPNSTFFEIKGPATFGAAYKWIEFQSQKMLRISVEIPVAPLGLSGSTYDTTTAATTLPATITYTASEAGDAPALGKFTVRTSGGTGAPIWAMFAWMKTPTLSPVTNSYTPFGLIPAAQNIGTHNTLTTFTSQGPGSPTYNGYVAMNPTSASGAGTGAVEFNIDPSVLEPDDFSDTVDLEVWVRYLCDWTMVQPKIVLSAKPVTTITVPRIYTSEFGQAGRTMVVPGGTATNCGRRSRLGVLTLPVNKAVRNAWSLKLDCSWAAGSSGYFGIDYIEIVPARSRALSKSGVANDSYYPDFIGGTADTTKTVDHKLTGMVGAGASVSHRDSGLGGSLLEFPPGDLTFYMKLSSLVPDDPTSMATSEQITHSIVSNTAKATIRPRYFLAKP